MLVGCVVGIVAVGIPVAASQAGSWSGMQAALPASHYDFGAQGWDRVAALVVSMVLSFFVANRVRVPALVLVTAAIVPLLPGLSIYRGLALFGQGGSAGLEAIALAAAIAIALSAGVILGQYVAQPLKREAGKLERRIAGPRLVGPLSVRALRRRPPPR